MSPAPPQLARMTKDDEPAKDEGAKAKEANGKRSKFNPRFRVLAHGATSLFRAQTLADNAPALGSSDSIGLLNRISVTLACPKTYMMASNAVFQKYALPCNRPGEPPGKELPTSRLVDIFSHWQIPAEHLGLFWALLRKEAKYWDSAVLPPAISLEDFQVVLVKVLRRVRNKCCATNLSKDHYVTHNKRKLEDDYLMQDSVGKGSFGECFWVTHKVAKTTRVVKSITKKNVNVPGEEIEMELNTLKRLDNPHVVKMFEWFESEESIFLVMEACNGGDLRNMLQKAKAAGGTGLPELMVQSIMQQSLRALVYIHAERVIHRDIKPANMLLTESEADEPRVLLADFGVAELFESEGPLQRHHAGTIPYFAPEVFQDSISPKADVWALGIVMYELLCGVRPFKGDNEMALYASIARSKGTVNMEPVKKAGTSEDACLFIQRLLTKDELYRPSAREAFQEAWLSDAGQSPLSQVPRRTMRKVSKALVNFGKKSTFSKALLNCIAGQLDNAKLEKLVSVFEALDTDHNGKLSVQELTEGLNDFGMNEMTVEALADALDLDNSGEIEYSEFIAGCLDAQTQLIDGVLHHAFSVFDVDRDGKISLDELRMMLSGKGPLAAVLPDGKTVEEVLNVLDTSKDGFVSEMEFKAYLEKESNGGRTPPAQEVKHGFGPPPSLSMPVEEVLLRLAKPLGRPEKELRDIAAMLQEKHWLSTVEDLRNLHHEDWPRLKLPLKLERAVRTYVDSCVL